MRDANGVEPATLAALSDDQWNRFDRLARDYRCGPYLANALTKIAPAIRRPALDRQRQASVFRNLKIGKECLRIHQILAAADIRHMFLKGVPLAFRDYPEAWLRPMRDIDVLVPAADAERAYDLLVDAGGTLEAFSQKPAKPTAQGKHMPPITSPGGVSLLELHYRALSPLLALDARYRDAFEREIWLSPNSIEIGGAEIPVPCDEILLIHMVIHGMLDHELNNGPLFITDVTHLMARGRIDQGRLLRLVDRTGTRRAFELTAALLAPATRKQLDFLGLRDPGVPEDVFTALLLQPVEDRYQLKMMADVAAISLPEKIALIGRRVFPDRATIRSRWAFDHGTAEAMPGNSLRLWLWFAASRVAGLFKRRANLSRGTRGKLLALRQALAENPSID